MPTIVTCACGAKLRLPEQTGNRSFRCPQCKTGIALTADVAVLSSAQLKPGEAGATCPICQSPIAAEEFVVTCPKCDQLHHRECWAEIGGCGTYGCEQAPSVEKGDSAVQQPLSAWGDTKVCPVCRETIKAIAVKCRYCGTEFGTVDPLTLQDVRRRIVTHEAASGLRKVIVALFIVSILAACLAPLTLVVGLCVVLPKHRAIVKEGPLFLVMAYSALAISLLYSFLLGIAVLAGGL